MSRALWLSVVAFVVSRALILAFPDKRTSTIRLNVNYGFESVIASNNDVSFYDLHAARTRFGFQSQGRTPHAGSGMVEYPPLVISWMALPVRLFGLAGDGPGFSREQMETYIVLERLALALVDALGFVFFFWILRFQLHFSAARCALAMASYALCGALLFSFIYDRMDIVVGTAIIAALAFLFSRFPYPVSFAVLALAINFKLVPLLLAPVFLVGSLYCDTFRKSGIRLAAALAGRAAVLTLLTAAIFLPYLLADGSQTLQFLRYHSARPIQAESLTANVLLFLHVFGLPLTAEHSYGSYNLVPPDVDKIAAAVSLCAAVLEVWVLRRMWISARRVAESCGSKVRAAAAYPRLFVQYSALLLAIAICGSKVFSAQYMLWFLALVPIAALDDGRHHWRPHIAFALACLLTTIAYPVFAQHARAFSVESPDGGRIPALPSALGIWILSARSACFICVTVWLWLETRRQSRGDFDDSVAIPPN